MSGLSLDSQPPSLRGAHEGEQALGCGSPLCLSCAPGGSPWCPCCSWPNPAFQMDSCPLFLAVLCRCMDDTEATPSPGQSSQRPILPLCVFPFLTANIAALEILLIFMPEKVQSWTQFPPLSFFRPLSFWPPMYSGLHVTQC